MTLHKAHQIKTRANKHQYKKATEESLAIGVDAIFSGDTHHCADKIKYGTLSTAKLAANAACEHYQYPMGVYRCPVCGGYHLTHRVIDEVRPPDWPPLAYVSQPKGPEYRRHISQAERIMWFRDRDGMSYDQIGDRMKISKYAINKILEQG